MTLSDVLPKHDTYFTSIVAKLLETIKSLASDQNQNQQQQGTSNQQSQDLQAKLDSYARVNDLPPTSYLIPNSGSRDQGWKWDTARWGSDGKVTEVVDALVKVSRAWPVWMDGIVACLVLIVAFLAARVGDEFDRFDSKAKESEL